MLIRPDNFLNEAAAAGAKAEVATAAGGGGWGGRYKHIAQISCIGPLSYNKIHCKFSLFIVSAITKSYKTLE